MFQFKDPLEKNIISGIVYGYTCSNCKATYYGKTRVAEHIEISNLTGKHLKNVKQSKYLTIYCSVIAP